MRQTLFFIPEAVGGWPLLGLGLVFWGWLAVCALVLAWAARKRGFSPELQSYLPLIALVAGVIWLGLPNLLEPISADPSAARGIPIRGFGVMVLLGIISGNALAAHQARKMGVNPDLVFNLAIWMFVAGFAGARTFYVLQYWDQFQQPTVGGKLWAMLSIAQGGIVVYGAVIGAAVALFAYCVVHRFPVLALADLIAPAIVLGYAFGRVGCFMNGCCFGGVCELPWAVSFPQDTPPYINQLDHGQLAWHGGLRFDYDGRTQPLIVKVIPGSSADKAGLQPGDRILQVAGLKVQTTADVRQLFDLRTGGKVSVLSSRQPTFVELDLPPLPLRSLPVHPTQLYASFNAFVLAGFLWAWYPGRRRDGEVIGLLLTLYPISRFLIESIRVDEPGLFGTELSIAQVISLVLLVLMVPYWLWLLRRPTGSALPRRPATETV